MAKIRYFGAGAVVNVETAPAAGTYFAVGLVRNYTPVPDTRSSVDLTGLEDPAYVGGLGIPEESLMQFEHIWDGNDALTPADGEADKLLDNYWASGASVLFQIVETDGVNLLTETIKGRVLRLEPTQVDATNGKRRAVTILRDGTFPRTRVFTPPGP